MKATTAKATRQSLDDEVQSALKWLKSHSAKATLDGMARYAIPSDNAYGVAMRDIKALGKTLGRNHELAVALWDTGVYEARMLASFVGDPAKLTPTQMDRWCKDFDNWAFCDAMSFNLFDRTPHEPVACPQSPVRDCARRRMWHGRARTPGTPRRPVLRSGHERLPPLAPIRRRDVSLQFDRVSPNSRPRPAGVQVFSRAPGARWGDRR